MVASFRESQQNCSAAVGVEELKLLAGSIRSAAHYYDEAFVDAPDRARLVQGLSECLEGTIRTVLENLTLSAEAIQQKTGANLDFVQHLEQIGNELTQATQAQLRKVQLSALRKQQTEPALHRLPTSYSPLGMHLRQVDSRNGLAMDRQDT